MRFYETLYIVDPNLESKILETIMLEIGKELERSKSKVINHRVWGKKRLAYQISNQKYGSYIILQFESSDLTKLNDFDVWMKLNNSVLRHMTVVLADKPEVYVDQSSSPEAPKQPVGDGETKTEISEGNSAEEGSDDEGGNNNDGTEKEELN